MVGLRARTRVRLHPTAHGRRDLYELLVPRHGRLVVLLRRADPLPHRLSQRRTRRRLPRRPAVLDLCGQAQARQPLRHRRAPLPLAGSGDPRRGARDRVHRALHPAADPGHGCRRQCHELRGDRPQSRRHHLLHRRRGVHPLLRSARFRVGQRPQRRPRHPRRRLPRHLRAFALLRRVRRTPRPARE